MYYYSDFLFCVMLFSWSHLLLREPTGKKNQPLEKWLAQSTLAKTSLDSYVHCAAVCKSTCSGMLFPHDSWPLFNFFLLNIQ